VDIHQEVVMTAVAFETMAVVERALGRAGSGESMLALEVVAAVGLYAGFRFAVSFSEATRVDTLRLLSALLAGVLSLAVTAAISSLYLLPLLSRWPIGNVVTLLVPILVLLAVGVPLQCTLLHGRYVPMLLAFAISLATTLMLVVAAGGMLDSMHAGRAESNVLRAQKMSTERFLNQQ